VGIPKDLDVRKTQSLGLKLVTVLVEDQLRGRIRLDVRKGTKFLIRFKMEC
jgi:two-component sensor histidine kinase